MPSTRRGGEAALFILTQIKKEGVPVDYAMVRVRGRLTEEGRPNSYPGACMATLQPHCKEGETHEKALERAFRGLFILDGLPENRRAFIEHEMFDHIDIVSLKEVRRPDVEVANYGTFVAFDFLKSARLSSSAFEGEVRYIAEADIVNIVDIERQKIDKRIGVTNSTVNAMFADQIKSLKLAFKLVRRPGFIPKSRR